jgi:hypothetical protein
MKFVTFMAFDNTLRQVKKFFTVYRIITIELFICIFFISYHFTTLISSGGWDIIFSTIAHVFTAFIGVIAIFFIFRLETYNSKIMSLYNDIAIISFDTSNAFVISPQNEIKKKKMEEINSLNNKKINERTTFIELLERSIPPILISIFCLFLNNTILCNDKLPELLKVGCALFFYIFFGLCLISFFEMYKLLSDYISNN